jgi:hypothetical protein
MSLRSSYSDDDRARAAAAIQRRSKTLHDDRARAAAPVPLRPSLRLSVHHEFTRCSPHLGQATGQTAIGSTGPIDFQPAG